MSSASVAGSAPVSRVAMITHIIASTANTISITMTIMASVAVNARSLRAVGFSCIRLAV